MALRVGLLLLLFVAGASAEAVQDHLECFRSEDPQPQRAIVAFDAPDVGMTLGCRLRRARYYCAPAAKTVLAHDAPLLPVRGPALSTGRLCYKVDCPKGVPLARTESDQFGTHALVGSTPALVCPPAGIGTAAPPLAANDTLQCFKVKDRRSLDATVALDTAHGAEPRCRVGRPRLLCVPGSLTVVRRRGRPVPATSFGPAPMTSDALCYSLRCPGPHPPDAEVADRFGTRTVKRLRPKLLCTPSQPGTVASTTTTTTVVTTTSTSTLPDDPALRCQRAIEHGGMAYVGTLLDAVDACATTGATGSLRACLEGATPAQSLADARAAWATLVAGTCAGTSVHATLGYLPVCGLASAPCAFDAGTVDAPGADNDLLDCLACQMREETARAATALFADRPATAACHQAIGAGAFQILKDVLQQARTCLEQPEAPSIAACFAPSFAAWRAAAVATCGAINPFTNYGYPELCAGVAPPGPADCTSNVPPCNFARTTRLNAPGFDDDLLDCMECQTEEGVLAVLRTLYGANLCCSGETCDTVQTRYGCRAAGGSPVYYRVAPVDVGPILAPHGIDVADDGTLYIADSIGRVKKRTAKGVVSVVGDTPYFPTGVAADADGNVYVTNRCLHQLRKLTPEGVSSVFAGTGVGGHTGDGGLAVDAQTVAVDGVTVDAAGNVYFTESGSMSAAYCDGFVPDAERVRMVDRAGIIHTVAGVGGISYENPDGPALLAGLFTPYGLHVGPSGRLFLGEAGAERAFRIDLSAGTIAWIAGRPLGPLASYAGDAGPARRMRFYENCGVDEDLDGNVIVGPMSNNRIVLVDKLGSAIVIAGNGLAYGMVADAPATLTAAPCPEDVAVGPDGRIWFSDIVNSEIAVLTRQPF
jgi:sugar lactone lactonase YvrE